MIRPSGRGPESEQFQVQKKAAPPPPASKAAAPPPPPASKVATKAQSAQAALKAAVAFALDGHVRAESIASFPVPGVGPYGPTFACMFSVIAPDVEGRDFMLYEPEFAVAINAGDLKVAACQRWRAPISAADQPLTRRLPPTAGALPAEELNARVQELLTLTDQVAPLAWKASDVPASQATLVQRYGALFKFLVPLPLMPFYEQLDIRFLGWVAAQQQGVGRMAAT